MGSRRVFVTSPVSESWSNKLLSSIYGEEMIKTWLPLADECTHAHSALAWSVF